MDLDSASTTGTLQSLASGQMIPYGGNRWTSVSAELASSFTAGDRLVVVQESGDLLHIPMDVSASTDTAVAKAAEAFSALGVVSNDSISNFYEECALNLANEKIFSAIQDANLKDVRRAQRSSRSTTRLVLDEKMRADMISALKMWRDLPEMRDISGEVITHDGWSVQTRRSPLGVVGFVFEGRPNVFADATGVLRSGNCVVFRIGSDALHTARAIMQHAVVPALQSSGLPLGAVQLVDSNERSAGYALFSNPKICLAVARGSGQAVAQLGAVARQSGIPVSLHGTGGAWMMATTHTPASDFSQAITASLDRKVCNTLNVCCIPRQRVELIRVAVEAALTAAARRSSLVIIHAVGDLAIAELKSIAQSAPSLTVIEHHNDEILQVEWEWDDVPEFSIRIFDGIGTACELFNRYSPHFILSAITNDAVESEEIYRGTESPFFGNGFTRWVDGQYALCRPELGLSNWQQGRLFGRGGVLSGDGVYSIRYVVQQSDFSQHR